ncbi:FRG domain-containing protein [Verrucomicrobiaceae bacterium R5-34]|nr:FRG domain-containing protein [Verrucomicrobiaceae bacterium R5-34]
MNEVIIESPDQLIETINQFPNGFVFRGQSNSTWPLTSSLERILEPVWNEENFDFKQYEDFTLKRFMGKFHLYSSDPLNPASKLETLALMQHYGAPTRLVDFTESPYLALYFAMESFNPLAGNNFSLFAVDCTSLMKKSLERLKAFDTKFNHDLASLEDEKDSIFDEIIDRFSLDLLWISEPKVINRRLDLQAGTFLTSINRSARIEDAMKNPIYDGVSMTKYTIPQKFYESVYALLRKVNITSKSIYGDLEGLGRSVRMELAAYARPCP